ncbi:MAG: hypothetical protein AABM30_00775 [Actinomycetota bacterium]
MSDRKNERLKKLAPHAALAAAILVGAALLGMATTARGASHRAQVATLDVTQTCATRVQPGTPVTFAAVVQNSGDEDLNITLIDADAGTPETPGDDIILTNSPHSGDLNNDGLLNPPEEWTYNGTYTALDEDETNIVGVDAVSVPGGTDVSDIAPCETDIVQPPVPGVIVAVKEVSGNVMIKKAGTNNFVPLNGQTEIPVGSQVDTLHGTIRLTASLGAGKTNTADFYQGVFTILQKKARGAFTTLRLDGGSFKNCGRASSGALSVEAKSRRPVRRVWGSGKGRFTTRGRYSSATVRGTKWLTLDRCDGTLTKVLRGIVRVRDFRGKKNVDVRAGHQYLARAPGA